jgi:tetratricopeptide (TPR) repeat protein
VGLSGTTTARAPLPRVTREPSRRVKRALPAPRVPAYCGGMTNQPPASPPPALLPPTSPPPASPPSVGELERRLRWPALPTLVFLGFLAMLLSLAGVSLWFRPAHPAGLPDDPKLLASAGLPDASLGVVTAGLRFRAAALGGEPALRTSDHAELLRAHDAEQRLRHWARRHPGEPRVRAALGALALVRHDYATAASHYREACERAPHYGEGRLGWGVALALDAARTTDTWQRRELMLRAIAQFAAVDPADAEYPAALYNRAQLLAEVGRRPEALAIAHRYLTTDPASAWSERLRAELLAP